MLAGGKRQQHAEARGFIKDPLPDKVDDWVNILYVPKASGYFEAHIDGNWQPVLGCKTLYIGVEEGCAPKIIMRAKPDGLLFV